MEERKPFVYRRTMLCMRVHGPGPGVKTGQTDKQADRQRKGWKLEEWGGGGGVLFPEDVSDCLASWVSALDWRNQVDRKGGSERGQPELASLKRFV